MNNKPRGLNRGLSELGINELLSDIKTEHKTDLRKLSIDMLEPGKYQPRRDINQEALEDLASSIRAQGIIQPIVVRPITNNRYEIIAGERRWRAAQLANLSEIPVLIRDIPDETAIALSLIENIQRENLNSIEEAISLQRLITEFNMTHQQIAEAVGKSRVTVTNLLRLLNLHPAVKTMVEHGDLEMGHARALLALESSLQIEAARAVIAKGMSVRETERLIRRLQQPKNKQLENKQNDPDIINLQCGLADKLGAKTIIVHNQKGNGKLIIHYNNLDELEGIINHIN